MCIWVWVWNTEKTWKAISINLPLYFICYIADLLLHPQHFALISHSEIFRPLEQKFKWKYFFGVVFFVRHLHYFDSGHTRYNKFLAYHLCAHSTLTGNLNDFMWTLPNTSKPIDTNKKYYVISNVSGFMLFMPQKYTIRVNAFNFYNNTSAEKSRA